MVFKLVYPGLNLVFLTKHIFHSFNIPFNIETDDAMIKHTTQVLTSKSFLILKKCFVKQISK